MPANNKSSYYVTIRREPPKYIARDDNGEWRTYGYIADSPAESGRELAEYLFHREEIGTVEVLPNGETRVEILQF